MPGRPSPRSLRRPKCPCRRCTGRHRQGWPPGRRGDRRGGRRQRPRRRTGRGATAIRAIIEEPDPAKQLHLYAHTQPGIWQRVGPLLRVLEAAAVSESDLRKLQQEQDSDRHAGLSRFTQLLEEHGALRKDLTPQHAADIIMTLGSFATYDSLVATRGWTHDQYETWLTNTLQHSLWPEPMAGRMGAVGRRVRRICQRCCALVRRP